MYFVWGLLPFTLLMMAIWGFLKPYLKVHGDERPTNYFKMFVFTAVIMGISVFVNERPETAEALDFLTMGFVSIDVVRFPIYPGLLLLAAQLSDRFSK